VDIDIKQSRSFSSPIYELMLDMIGRILSGNPAMYSEIQIHNPYSAEIEDIFLENAGRLKAAVDAGDSRAFQRIMIEAGKHYDDLDSAFSKSSRAVSALYEEYLKIKASAGRRVALRNEVTGAIHVGQIKGISGEHVTIGHGKRTKRLKVSNVSLLPDSESRSLRAEKFGTSQRDISLLFPVHADPVAIADILEKCDDDLVSASAIDEYRGEGIPDFLKSITFRLTIFGDLDVTSAEKGAKKMLRSIGALER
jgi:prephenate dehydrogenase